MDFKILNYSLHIENFCLETYKIYYSQWILLVKWFTIDFKH